MAPGETGSDDVTSDRIPVLCHAPEAGPGTDDTAAQSG